MGPVPRPCKAIRGPSKKLYKAKANPKDVPGIADLEIQEAYLDKTDKTGRFVAVTVKFIKKLKAPVPLETIKKNKELSHLSLIRQSRLSVMPIDSKSWKILNNMSKI